MTRDQLTHTLDLLYQQRTRQQPERHGRSSTDPRKPARLDVTGTGMPLPLRRLRRVEDALIAAVLDAHPNASPAVDRLLDDLGVADSVRGQTNRRFASGDCIESERVEVRLVGLILDRHPRREAAFERLLSDLGQTAGETPMPSS